MRIKKTFESYMDNMREIFSNDFQKPFIWNEELVVYIYILYIPP